jgi:Flp pilus assembly protein TadG
MGPLKLHRRLACERGSELIEFAIVAPLLLVVLFGIIDFAFMFQRYEVLTNAAREGARIAVLPEYTYDDVKNRVTQYLDINGMTGATFAGSMIEETVHIGTGGAPPCVTLRGVTVTYPYNFLAIGKVIKLVGSGSGFATKNMTVTAKMRFEGPAGTCP